MIDIEEIKRFEKANKEFDTLIKNGLLKKRGYTLATIEDHFKVINVNNNKIITLKNKYK